MSYADGWSNWETKVVHIWITQDGHLYEAVSKQHLLYCEDSVDKMRLTKAEKVLKLADGIEYVVNQDVKELPNLRGDLLRCAVERVNWKSLAKNWMEEHKE
jgi:hypothetical protein